MPKIINEALLWPDTHEPYGHRQSVAVAQKVLASMRPKTFIMLGDYYDMYKVSPHPKSAKRDQTFEQELTQARKYMSELQSLRERTQPKGA
ncbi:MAG: hypothetical protein MN733_02690, partial [Nitrososphaera sp.]|nr:hypothetical protein [Nitrososphaera sp.]